MNELIQVIWEFLKSDDGPDLWSRREEPMDDDELLEVAQEIAGAIVAAGWPGPGWPGVQA